MKNSESPSSPVIDDCISTNNKEIFYGLTKREHFASLIIPSVITKFVMITGQEGDIAELSVKMADELIKELEKC